MPSSVTNMAKLIPRLYTSGFQHFFYRDTFSWEYQNFNKIKINNFTLITFIIKNVYTATRLNGSINFNDIKINTVQLGYNVMKGTEYFMSL
jgi:hypothetical protein